MEAGKLNRRFRIEAPVDGEDDAGTPLTGYTEVATVYANIRHLNGVQAIRAGADTSTVKASVCIRKRSGITAAMRGTDLGSGTVYDIRAVLPDLENNAFMYLTCETVT